MRRLGWVASIALRGLVARRVLTAGSLLLTVIAVASAVVGPIYQRAAAQSFMVTKLASELDVFTGTSFVYQPAAGTAPARALRHATHQADDVMGTGYLPAHGILEARTPTLPIWTPEGAIITFDSVEGQCEHVLLRGRCPTRAGEVALLVSDAKKIGVRTGATLHPWGDDRTLHVVGTYLPPSAADDVHYWFDLGRLSSQPEIPPTINKPGVPYQPAPFLTTADAMGGPLVPDYHVLADKRIVVTPNLTVAALQDVADRIAKITKDSLLTNGRVRDMRLVPGNALPQEAAKIIHRREVSRSTVSPAVASLILVALVLLLRLMSAALGLRQAELALASLRGYSRRSLWVLGLVEPLLVIAIATPLGLVTGYAAARGLAQAWLVDGLDVPFGAESALAVAAVVVVASAVAAVVVRNALSEPLSTQIQGATRPKPPSRWVLIGQLALVAAAVATAATGLGRTRAGAPDAADLLLPILLAVAAGLVSGLTARTLAGWWVRLTGRRRGLWAYVASRTVHRRREGTLVALPLTAAVAVAVFAYGVYGAAATWRASDAATEVGAAEAYDTSLSLGQAVALTHRIDPDGRWLMALGVDYPVQGDPRVVVDAPRLARVASWPSSWVPGETAQTVAHQIGAGPSVVLSGRRLSLTVDNGVRGTYPTLGIVMSLLDDDGNPVDVTLGPFPRGTSTHGARLPGCARGCVVQALHFGGPTALTETMRGSATLTDARVDGRPVSMVDRGWRTLRSLATPHSSVQGQPRTAGGGLRVSFHRAPTGADASVSPDDVPAVLPVLRGRISRETTSIPSGAQDVTLPVRPVATAESMPYLGPAGMMLDWTVFARSVSTVTGSTTVVVLARGDTPASVVSELNSAGLSSPRTEAAARAVLGQDAFALALKLYIVVTILVVLLALAGLGANLAVQMPARRRDAASLRVVGTRKRSIVGAVIAEFVMVLGAAALAGVAAGGLAQLIVVRTVVLGFADDERTPRVLPSFSLADAGLLALATVVLLGLVGVLVASATVRGARTSSLRENAR